MAYRVRQGDSWASLGKKYPKIKEDNPGISNPKPGMVLETGYEAPNNPYGQYQYAPTLSKTPNPYSQYQYSFPPKNPYGQYNYMNKSTTPPMQAGSILTRGTQDIGMLDLSSTINLAIEQAQKQSNQPQPKQKTYVQQWADGSMTGAQMRAIYGKGWKDRMKIKTPKGKLRGAKKVEVAQENWLPGNEIENGYWRI